MACSTLMLILALFCANSVKAQSPNDDTIQTLIRTLMKKMTDLEKQMKSEREVSLKLVGETEKNHKEIKEMVKQHHEDLDKLYQRLKKAGKREFLYSKNKVRWSEAESACKKWGGHLLTMKSHDENDYFYEELKKRDLDNGIGVWIGFNDVKEEGKWMWEGDEESFYTNWHAATGEPNGGRAENCGTINVSEVWKWDGMWDDGECDIPRPFVCERIASMYTSIHE